MFQFGKSWSKKTFSLRLFDPCMAMWKIFGWTQKQFGLAQISFGCTIRNGFQESSKEESSKELRKYLVVSVGFVWGCLNNFTFNLVQSSIPTPHQKNKSQAHVWPWHRSKAYSPTFSQYFLTQASPHCMQLELLLRLNTKLDNRVFGDYCTAHTSWKTALCLNLRSNKHMILGLT